MESSLRGPRRTRPRPERQQAETRAAAQQHLDARLERLQAYAAALEAAITAHPPDARLGQLERQLDQARRDVRSAGRSRLPALAVVAKLAEPVEPVEPAKPAE